MSVDLLLYIAAAVFFALDAFRVAARINWTPLGFCLLTIAFFIA